MNVIDIIKSRRTIRKYKQDKIDRDMLMDLVDCGRLAPSAMNKQPLEYLVVDSDDLLEPVFQTLKWAGYIAPHGTPVDGEKPVAYIIILVNKELENPWHKHDIGAAAQNIMIGAQGLGIGTCWIGSVDKKKLTAYLEIPDTYHIDTVISLGYPAEESVYEDEQGSIKYYKDDNNTLHVPKRHLNKVMHINKW